jgi:hypothetical protein
MTLKRENITANTTAILSQIVIYLHNPTGVGFWPSSGGIVS